MSGDWNQTPLPDGTIRVTKRHRVNPLIGKPHPAVTTTDRRDATDAQFADELARLDRLDVADESAVERVARAMWETDHKPSAWEWPVNDGQRSYYRDLARAAIDALKPAPGTDTEPPFDLDAACQPVAPMPSSVRTFRLVPTDGAPGTDSSGPSDYPALRDALCRYLDHQADYADRGDLNADFEELWTYVAPVLPGTDSSDEYAGHVGSCRMFYAERRCTCAGPPFPGTDSSGQAQVDVLRGGEHVATLGVVSGSVSVDSSGQAVQREEDDLLPGFFAQMRSLAADDPVLLDRIDKAEQAAVAGPQRDHEGGQQ